MSKSQVMHPQTGRRVPMSIAEKCAAQTSGPLHDSWVRAIEHATAAKGAVTITQSIPAQRIEDLLCCAFEGGSNYWVVLVDEHKPAAEPWEYLFQVPLRGGALIFTADEHDNPDSTDGRWILDAAALTRGAQSMAEKAPRHWGDFMAENDDATTGDVFLQCCLFGEIVFG